MADKKITALESAIANNDTDIFLVIQGSTPRQIARSLMVQSIASIYTVNHGATAGTTRPTNSAPVTWVGSVEPSNAVNGDLWVDTA